MSTTRAARRAAAKPRRRASVASVLGELLMTAGVVLGLFVVWQLFIGDTLISNERYATAETLASEWVLTAPRIPAPEPESDEAGNQYFPPPALPHPADAEIFATIQVPRFGSEYRYPVAGGITRGNTLDNIGVGVYDQAVMPGQIGNFSLAGHRAGWGGAFHDLDKLRLGDAIVFETEQGWFTYRFRDIEYVTPQTITVLDAVPHAPEVEAKDAVLTITACSPIGTIDERIIAYAVFEGFQPRALGAPDSLAEAA